jgi:hypothetical protein
MSESKLSVQIRTMCNTLVKFELYSEPSSLAFEKSDLASSDLDGYHSSVRDSNYFTAQAKCFFSYKKNRQFYDWYSIR